MSAGERSGRSSRTRVDASISFARTTDDKLPVPGLQPSSARFPQAETTPKRSGLPASVVHELRTPLTSIHGYTQVLQRSMGNEQRTTNALAVILRESTRLSSMLSELAELAEIESQAATLEPIDVDVHQVIDGVVHAVARRDGGAHPIHLEGSAMARCHPTILSQAALHVVTNAVNYSESGTPVTVQIGAVDGMATIVVGDRGISVDPADAERIYEPFERGENARAFGTRGLGLGLYLARQAIWQVGGDLYHRHREGGGTWFRLVVPQAATVD
jgi:two-component system, OmpR family, phosphate regulon sensor histidine kinase PhoR